jgi:hypothetical protein
MDKAKGPGINKEKKRRVEASTGSRYSRHFLLVTVQAALRRAGNLY